MPTIEDVIRLQEDTPEADIKLWKQLGCKIDCMSGLWVTPAGQTCITDKLAIWVIDCVHFATHSCARANGDVLLATWWHPRLQTLARGISGRCLVCQQHNPGKGVHCGSGKAPLPIGGPFDTLQMDCIELERCQEYRYVLVIVNVVSG